jgi:hypothetical protein
MCDGYVSSNSEVRYCNFWDCSLYSPHHWKDGRNSKYGTSYFEKFHRYGLANKEILFCGRSLGSFFDLVNMTDDEPEKASHTIQFVVVSLVGRRVITISDSYLRLAPETTRHGDFIVILHDCSFPVVLRREENRYQVIGECYPHGLKDGKILCMARAGKCSGRNLKLSG